MTVDFKINKGMEWVYFYFAPWLFIRRNLKGFKLQWLFFILWVEF